MLSDFKIDRLSEIFTLFEDTHDGGGTPAVNILERLVFIHALAVLRQINGGNPHLAGSQLLGNLVRAMDIHRHGENAAYHSGNFLVNDPFLPFFIHP